MYLLGGLIMAEEIRTNSAPGVSCFKEAVCVNAGRIYDSCSSEDLPLSESFGKRFRVTIRRNSWLHGVAL